MHHTESTLYELLAAHSSKHRPHRIKVIKTVHVLLQFVSCLRNRTTTYTEQNHCALQVSSHLTHFPKLLHVDNGGHWQGWGQQIRITCNGAPVTQRNLGLLWAICHE